MRGDERRALSFSFPLFLPAYLPASLPLSPLLLPSRRLPLLRISTLIGGLCHLALPEL